MNRRAFLSRLVSFTLSLSYFRTQIDRLSRKSSGNLRAYGYSTFELFIIVVVSTDAQVLYASHFHTDSCAVFM